MFDWPQQALTLLERRIPCVAVTIVALRGSAPREIGSKMLVTEDAQFGSIGGGYLEHECVRRARQALSAHSGRYLHKFALGSQCGQCCGGAVEVHGAPCFEVDRDWLGAVVERQNAGLLSALITPLADSTLAVQWAPADTRFDAAITAAGNGRILKECVGPAPLKLTIFGAGHVGRAVAKVFGTLDAQTIVVDNRQVQLDDAWPDNCAALFVADPVSFVAHGTAGQHYLVMTHDHDLDFRLCSELLARGDAQFIGLIGSATKRRRFDKRWRASGFDAAAIASITCPIGAHSVTGKHPGEIAVAATAEILLRRQTAVPATQTSLTLVNGVDT